MTEVRRLFPITFLPHTLTRRVFSQNFVSSVKVIIEFPTERFFCTVPKRDKVRRHLFDIKDISKGSCMIMTFFICDTRTYETIQVQSTPLSKNFYERHNYVGLLKLPDPPEYTISELPCSS